MRLTAGHLPIQMHLPSLVHEMLAILLICLDLSSFASILSSHA